jgi:hypothetical protein
MVVFIVIRQPVIGGVVKLKDIFDYKERGEGDGDWSK